jgi:hypothetical protein
VLRQLFGIFTILVRQVSCTFCELLDLIAMLCDILIENLELFRVNEYRLVVFCRKGQQLLLTLEVWPLIEGTSATRLDL